MVQKQVTPRGGWGRRPKGDAPRSEAFALGARWLSPARPQPPSRRLLESPTHPRPALNFLLLHLQQSYHLDRPASRQNINCQGQFLDFRS
ncbi:MAG: hypothetical protein ACLQU5_23180, partial [Isosphaeraceae bacterium]